MSNTSALPLQSFATCSADSRTRSATSTPAPSAARRRKNVHAADNRHVVGPAVDFFHAPLAARRGRQKTREVARAVADHRQRLLSERGEDQFALLALCQRLAALRVHDFRVEMVLPDR